MGQVKREPLPLNSMTIALEGKISRTTAIWLGAGMMLVIALLSSCSDESTPPKEARILPSPTATPSPIPTATPAPTQTATPIAAPSPIATATPAPTQTAAPIATPSPIPTATPAPTQTAAPIATPSPIATATPTHIQTATPIAAPSPAQLCWAIRNGSVDEVERILAANLDVGARHCSGNPPLYAAVREEEPEIVRILVDAGADVNARDSSGNPILYNLIWWGRTEMVRILVDAGADVDARDRFDNPILYTAAREEEPEIVRILVDAGADVNARDSSGSPILYDLIWWGQANMVRILVEEGVDVNTRNSYDDPLLHTAITADRSGPEMVRILVDAGADVDARDRRGTSLVKLAFEENETEIVRILVDAGAEVDFPPGHPSINVIDRSDSSLTVRVTGGGGVETHYAVRRRNATESGEWVDMEVRYTDGRIEDQGLNADSTYYYALQACNAAGCSELSSETGGVTESSGQVEAPVAPSLDGERVKDRAIAALSWTKGAGATYFEIYQDAELDARVSAPQTAVHDYSPNSSYVWLSGWTFNETTYRVKACNKAGCSQFSISITLP